MYSTGVLNIYVYSEYNYRTCLFSFYKNPSKLKNDYLTHFTSYFSVALYVNNSKLGWWLLKCVFKFLLRPLYLEKKIEREVRRMEEKILKGIDQGQTRKQWNVDEIPSLPVQLILDKNVLNYFYSIKNLA